MVTTISDACRVLATLRGGAGTDSEVIRDPAAGRVGRRPHNHQAGGRC